MTPHTSANDGRQVPVSKPAPPERTTRYSLIEKLKNSADQESWGRFLQTYGDLIENVARKAGLTPGEAEEVVQNTVLSVSRKIKAFKADPKAGSFKSWLLQMTRWRVLDQLDKRTGSRPENSHSDNAGDEGPATSITDRVRDPAGGGFEGMWETEWREFLKREALALLKNQVKERPYQIFVHLMEGQRPAEVARTLGINVAQVHLVKFRVGPLYRKLLRQVEHRELESGVAVD